MTAALHARYERVMRGRRSARRPVHRGRGRKRMSHRERQSRARPFRAFRSGRPHVRDAPGSTGMKKRPCARWERVPGRGSLWLLPPGPDQVRTMAPPRPIRGTGFRQRKYTRNAPPSKSRHETVTYRRERAEPQQAVAQSDDPAVIRNQMPLHSTSKQRRTRPTQQKSFRQRRLETRNGLRA